MAGIVVTICMLAGILSLVLLSGERQGNIGNLDTITSNNSASNESIASADMSNITLCGLVTDKNWDGVPGARVTLWETRYDNATGQYINVRLAAIENNPMTSNENRSDNILGFYIFHVVSQGTYNVTAEIFDNHWSVTTTIDKPGLWALNVNSTDFVYPGNMDNGTAYAGQ